MMLVKKVLKMFTFEGRMQDERRARISTKATPMAEYQIDETSYKSVKRLALQKFQNIKKLKHMTLISKKNIKSKST